MKKIVLAGYYLLEALCGALLTVSFSPVLLIAGSGTTGVTRGSALRDVWKGVATGFERASQGERPY